MIIRSALYILIALMALHTGIILGYIDGFDTGHKVGVIDAEMKAQGKCFMHNGKCE